MNKYYGFSLIELLIVITIVGILSAIAIPGYKSYTHRVILSQGVPIAEDVSNKIRGYYEAKGVFPATMNQIGFNSTTTDFPQDLPPATNDAYFAPPYILGINMGTTDKQPGQCAYYGVNIYISNFDSSGAITSANQTSSYAYYSLITALMPDNTWKSICGFVEIDSDGNGGMSYNAGDLIPGCYNIAYNSSVIDDLVNMCP